MWASLLLCAGLWACTDDAIEGQQGTNGSGGEGVPAYITISFSANAGSSTRAGEGVNTGDTDGDADDSGHHSDGTDAEGAVKKALVIVAPQDGNVGFAKLYVAGESGDLTAASGGGQQGTDGSDEVFTIYDDQTKSYYNDDPIKVATGTYKVLVVINPVEAITDKLGENTTSIEDGAQVRELYDFVVDGKYVSTAYSGNAADTKYVMDMASETNGFMMANREEEEVELTEENTPDNPKQAEVNVERVISKITFRADSKNQNVYTVSVPGTVKAKTVQGWVVKEQTEGAGTQAAEVEYELATLNEAHDANVVNNVAQPNTVYVRYKAEEENVGEQAEPEDKNDHILGVYRQTKETKTGTGSEGTFYIYEKIEAKTQTDYDKEDDKTNYFVVANTSDIDASLTLQAGGEGEDQSLYVKLVGYALTNLSTEVFYVRHTVGSAPASPFGTLGATNYLYTPYWEAKNAVTFTDDNQFPTGVNTDTWFHNTLAEVSTESETLTYNSTGENKFQISNGQSSTKASEYFKELPTGEGETVENVSDIVGDNPQHPEAGGSLAKTGGLMSYCFENSVMAEKQVHGLTTGIVFVGMVYKDESCTTEIDELYKYGDHVFMSLQAIKEAYGDAVDIDADWLNGTKTPTAAELAEKNIMKYESGLCYYYTSRIKHFDNGDDTNLGIMEYAIMRNNIYSLSVTGISDIGSPIVDPTPDIPNESKEAALSLKVNILPWIVRYNDIEF